MSNVMGNAFLCVRNQIYDFTKVSCMETNAMSGSELDLVIFGEIILGALFQGNVLLFPGLL